MSREPRTGTAAAQPDKRLSGWLAPVGSGMRSWEGFLLVILVAAIVVNSLRSEAYLTFGNQANLLQLYIEKIIVALAMTFIIINAEIDLSVASIMGLAATAMATVLDRGGSLPVALLVGLAVGPLCGAFNGFWVAYAGLPSLVVTLATLIGFRGLVLVLVQDASITGFPEVLNRLGQQPIAGPVTLAMITFAALAIVAAVILHLSGFGRHVYAIGNNKEASRYSGVKVRSVKMILFIASGTVAALAGILYAARLGAVRGSTADGFELEIITMVLLGGVNIFGGKGSLWGVLLSILIILNLRNGMGLAGLSGHLQTGVIGVLLILSVLVPHLASRLRERINRRRLGHARELAEAG